MNYQDKTIPELIAELQRLDNEIHMASFSDAYGVYSQTHRECTYQKNDINREIQARGYLAPGIIPEKQPEGLRHLPVELTEVAHG